MTIVRSPFSNIQWMCLRFKTVLNAFFLAEKAIPTLASSIPAVIVVGHSNCGGAAACLSAAQRPDTIIGGRVITVPQLPADAPLNRWLGPLTEHVTTLDLANKPTESALPVVVKENVRMQVENLCKSEVIADAWVAWNEKREGAAEVWVHGWVYDLATGRLEDLKISKGPGSAI